MKETILLVDDNLELLEVLTDELSEIYEIKTATNGEEALATLGKWDLQAIICDVMMPIMDGFEFCRIIKSGLNYSQIPVILLTAKNTLQSKITGLELGADAYIEKPFEVELLLVQLANLISNRKKIASYFTHRPMALTDEVERRSDAFFIEKLNAIISEHMEDQSLDIEKLSKLTNTSRSSLFRKVKAIANLTPNEFINVARLKKASQLLIETDLKIFEIAYMLGFSSQTSFGRNFLRQFHETPTEYQKRKKWK